MYLYLYCNNKYKNQNCIVFIVFFHIRNLFLFKSKKERLSRVFSDIGSPILKKPNFFLTFFTFLWVSRDMGDMGDKYQDSNNAVLFRILMCENGKVFNSKKKKKISLLEEYISIDFN